MGLMKINGQPVITPSNKMVVKEVKALAGIGPEEKLYRKNGQIIVDDKEIIETDDVEYGSVTDWVRG
jgi:hypothetical protein